MSVTIRRATALTDAEIEALAELLAEVVAEGASLGLLPPVELAMARDYWRRIAVGDGVLLLAEIDEAIVGTVQVQHGESENGRHRGEICKLLVHPGCRRRGIGRVLMERAEGAARAAGKTLLVLDAREGDPSNDLYRSLGYLKAGAIPDWSRDADGAPRATAFFYKPLMDDAGTR
ncbi:MAG: GNAT family N-acetyltransferase [Thermomicrobiales bacterium]|nr:GNAT family N-acetyltransferase [Thermomicrobiales bacterium]